MIIDSNHAATNRQASDQEGSALFSLSGIAALMLMPYLPDEEGIVESANRGKQLASRLSPATLATALRAR